MSAKAAQLEVAPKAVASPAKAYGDQKAPAPTPDMNPTQTCNPKKCLPQTDSEHDILTSWMGQRKSKRKKLKVQEREVFEYLAPQTTHQKWGSCPKH